MLFRSFAQLILLALGLVFFAALFLAAGALGWLGPLPQSHIGDMWKAATETYYANKAAIDWALTAGGVVLSAVTGGFAIYKSWYYAELSLPARLDELIKRNTNRHLTERQWLLPLLRGDCTLRSRWAPDQQSLFERFLHLLGIPAKRLAAVSSASETLLQDLRVLDQARQKCAMELCTAYLASGFQSARTAGEDLRTSAYFGSALTFAPTDLDALELAARDAFAPGTPNGVSLKYLLDLENAAAQAGNPVRQARAIRFQAEILLDRPARNAWDGARVKLIGAIDRLRNQAVEVTPSKELELGRMLELLAATQMRRERLNAARAALEAAKLHMSNAVSRSRRRGLKRLKELELQLDQAENDRDNPNITD